MGESGPHGLHLNPNPRTNKQTLEQFKLKLEKIIGIQKPTEKVE
jgi:Tfp pilus assembly protein PilP